MEIHIISGFLGSGKTSLLRRLLLGTYIKQKDPSFRRRMAVLENEFGKIAFDASLLRSEGNDLQLYEMDSGCLCCTLKDDFGTTIKSLLRKKEVKHLLVEPSGVALTKDLLASIQSIIFKQNLFLQESGESASKLEGSSILKNSLAEQSFLGNIKQKIKSFVGRSEFSWEGLSLLKRGKVIHLLDASLFSIYEANFKNFYKNQIEEADLFVINRFSGLTEEERKILAEKLRSYRPQASFLWCDDVSQLDEESLWSYILGENSEDAADNLSTSSKDFGKRQKPGNLINITYKKEEHSTVYQSYLFWLKEKTVDLDGGMACSAFSEASFLNAWKSFCEDSSKGFLLRSKGFLPKPKSKIHPNPKSEDIPTSEDMLKVMARDNNASAERDLLHFEYTPSTLKLSYRKMKDESKGKVKEEYKTYIVFIGQNLDKENCRIFLEKFWQVEVEEDGI